MGVCETLCDESCLGTAPRWLAIVWLPRTGPAGVHSTIRPMRLGLCRFFQRQYLSGLILERIHALQELTSFCRCQRSHHFSFPYQMTRGSIPELHFEQLVRVVFQGHRRVFSCHHGLLLSRVVQCLWLRFGKRCGWLVRTDSSCFSSHSSPYVWFHFLWSFSAGSWGSGHCALSWYRWAVHWRFVLSGDAFVREVAVLKQSFSQFHHVCSWPLIVLVKRSHLRSCTLHYGTSERNPNCGIFDDPYLTKLTTLCGDPIQQFLTSVAAILNPKAFPMTSDTVHCHKCRGQSRHQ